MSRWRYIAQHAVTKQFLHWDVPIEAVPTWELSGPGSLTGTVSPDVGELRTEDGDLVLQEWATLLYAEADGIIRWGGIVVDCTFNGDGWSIEAAGFSTYPTGLPYTGEIFSRVGVDPVECVKEIWRHVQSYPEGDLGVLVTGDTTPARLGEPAKAAYVEYRLDPTKDVWIRASEAKPGQIRPSTSGELSASMTASQTTVPLLHFVRYDEMDDLFPYTISIGNEKMRVTGRNDHTLTGVFRGVDGTTATGHNKGTAVEYTGTESRKVEAIEAEPYLLAWYETTDCGAEIDNLAKTTPFDYTERHYWADAAHTQVGHEVQIHYPRLGRKRTDLAFVQGDNVTNVASFQSNGDQFANEVVGLGAGEGRATLRRTTARRDGRLRRSTVFSDKAVNASARMDALIADELERRRGLLEVTQIDVTEHANAPIGSWSVGDDILVRFDVPWIGRVDLWVRITGWSLTSDTTASLTVARSDSFHYGG